MRAAPTFFRAMLIALFVALLALVSGAGASSPEASSAAPAALAEQCAAAADEEEDEDDEDDEDDGDDGDDEDDGEDGDDGYDEDDDDNDVDEDDDRAPAPASPAPVCAKSGPPPPAPPRYGERLNATPVGGTVRVKLKGSGRFIPLAAAASIPVGSTFDSTRGELRLTTVRTRSGRRQSAIFTGSRFRVSQRDTKRRITDLLPAGPVLDCKAGRGPSAAASRSAGGLWGRGTGRFRTRGRHGAATVRGTVWGTIDSCRGTLVIVKRGVVAVRDFARKRTVTVRAGERYLARAPRSR